MHTPKTNVERNISQQECELVKIDNARKKKLLTTTEGRVSRNDEKVAQLDIDLMAVRAENVKYCRTQKFTHKIKTRKNHLSLELERENLVRFSLPKDFTRYYRQVGRIKPVKFGHHMLLCHMGSERMFGRDLRTSLKK